MDIRSKIADSPSLAIYVTSHAENKIICAAGGGLALLGLSVVGLENKPLENLPAIMRQLHNECVKGRSGTMNTMIHNPVQSEIERRTIIAWSPATDDNGDITGMLAVTTDSENMDRSQIQRMEDLLLTLAPKVANLAEAEVRRLTAETAAMEQQSVVLRTTADRKWTALTSIGEFLKEHSGKALSGVLGAAALWFAQWLSVNLQDIGNLPSP